MLRTRIILFASAAILTALLFSLPKVVVDNDPDKVSGKTAQNTPSETNQQKNEDASHAVTMSKNDEEKIILLKRSYHSSKIKEKSAIFADSLAKVFESINMLDSAAKYKGVVAELIPEKENWINAGNSYYKAFEFAVNPEKAKRLGTKSREYFQKVFETGENDPQLKVKMAMTLISTANPMQGIMMLREVIEEDPENTDAIFNMGLLSIQSNQYDKAVERFSKLSELQPDNAQAYFYLGISYKEIGEQEMARKQFEKVKSLSDDPAVNATVDSYLQEIN